jgi:hypothetical protein
MRLARVPSRPTEGFAILYPVRDEDSNQGPALPNVLVRLKPYEVIKELDIVQRGKECAVNRRHMGGNDFVAIWKQMKWGKEDLVVYEIVNDKIKREETKIWPEVVKYFEANDRYFFISDDSKFKNFEFKDDALLLNIRAENKPNLAAGPIWNAELRTVWNLKTGKFDKVDFKPGEISIRKPEDI